jgi:hypothetical protein
MRVLPSLLNEPILVKLDPSEPVVKFPIVVYVTPSEETLKVSDTF